jgi:hypothetical protein
MMDTDLQTDTVAEQPQVASPTPETTPFDPAVEDDMIRVDRLRVGRIYADLLIPADTSHTVDQRSLDYGRGLVKGIVATLMAVSNRDFEEVMPYLRQIKPDLDWRCIPRDFGF